MEEGGDPACWAHLHDEPVTPPSAELFGDMLTLLPLPVLLGDDAGRITFWNDACEALLGWEAERVIGQPLDVMLPPARRAEFRDHYHALLRGQARADEPAALPFSVLHRSGRELPVSLSLAALGDGGVARPSAIGVVLSPTS